MTMKRLISLRRRQEQEEFAFTGVAMVKKLGSEDGVTEIWNIHINEAYTFDENDFLGAPAGSTFINADDGVLMIKLDVGTWVTK